MAGLTNFLRRISSWLNGDNSQRYLGSYLLEYRYSGYPKSYIADLHYELRREFGIVHPLYHYVPHITIVGPIFTNLEVELIEQIRRIIFKYAHHFHKPGNLVGTGKFITFETSDGGQILGVKIKPPRPLINLKKEIEKNLMVKQGYRIQTYDKEIWHTTLWNMKNNEFANMRKFELALHSLGNSPQEMKFILDRITLVKNGKILEEYDLFNKETLDREDALNEELRYESYLELKSELESKGEHFKY